MRKKIAAIVCVALVLVSFVVPSFAAVSDEWLNYDWVPDYDYLEGLRNFTSYPGYARYNDTEPYTYSIGGSWRFSSSLDEIRVAFPEGVPTAVDKPVFLLTQYGDGPDSNFAYALTVVYGGSDVATGGIGVGLIRDPDDADYGYVNQIISFDYPRGVTTVIWDRETGYSNASYTTLSFGYGAVDPQISPTAYSLLVDSGIITPVEVDYGGGIESLDFTTWLATAVGGFFSFSLFNGFTLGHMIGCLVAFSFVMMFLKFFAGG